VSGQVGRNAAQVLPRLKDFQRTSVEYAYRRMYQDPDCTTRFLVADEVGLGKTMVARGIIARALDELLPKVPRVDIIYVCSNSAIARQNIDKLAMEDTNHVVPGTRITLLPLESKGLRNHRVNLISITPGTSIDLGSSLGMYKERVLLYYLLKEAWGVSGAASRALLRGGVSRDNFRALVSGFDQDVDEALTADYLAVLRKRPDLRLRFEQLADQFNGVSDIKRLPKNLRDDQRHVVGTLRDLLAKVCLRALEPDLIILDEFQRFKHLLDAEDEESVLAQELFDYTDAANNQARVLLLSATPYKMYTESEEASGEDHYQDFLATVRFLQKDPARTAVTERLLDEYRKEWLRQEPGYADRIRILKRELEGELKRVMIRTERLAVTEDRNGMLTTVPATGMGLEPRDALTYRQLGRIAESVEHSDPIEYWKSAPYLLSFMEDYKLKTDILEAFCGPECRAGVIQLLDEALPLQLPWAEVEKYRQLDPSNARMKWLVSRMVDSGAWQLLWVPPSRPWYSLAGPYAAPGLDDFTKTLVFSGWKVVPKAIAALVSYEAERRMMEAGGNSENSAEARKAFSPPLRADQESLFTLVYPSPVLARLASEVAADSSRRDSSAEEVVNQVAQRVESLLSALPAGTSDGRPDLAWYWAAPAMLDWKDDAKATEDALTEGQLWASDQDSQQDLTRALGAVHSLQEVAHGGRVLGLRPPDLARVLALVALAGPATAALRSLTTALGDSSLGRERFLRTAASHIGYAFRGYYNLPEVVHLVRSISADVPYWQQVLEYGLNGGIGAVLEEYLHVLKEWLGLNDHIPEKAAPKLAATAAEALAIRTASLTVDTFMPGRGGALMREPKRLRSRYAARLADERGEDDKEAHRVDHVRTAFNSPFWPFVLATTSIGQEGLDFHLYCHAVVHWNLPSNPVDLEQREGRVHRYKGHAVRKNVARRHGAIAVDGDPWTEMFRIAEGERPAGSSEIWPYWVYPVEGGAKIERHVPALPLSRDVLRLERVRRMSALYRMVFGQVRQEDLMTYLTARGVEEDPSLLIDLHP
jgi:hypothetical protein